MKYTKEQIAKVARECAKQEALHDNEYLGKIGCMLDDLMGRIAELEKDAARYRWLRDSSRDEFSEGVAVDVWDDDATGRQLKHHELDAAIDAAMQGA